MAAVASKRLPREARAATAVFAAAVALVAALAVDAANVRAAACAATTVTAPVVADTWVDENAPATAKGSDVILSIESGDVHPDTGAPFGRARALLRFALPPAAPPGCVVASAKLVAVSTEEDVGAQVEAVRLAAAWSESEANWINQPATVGAAAQAWSREGVMQWNVTAQVQAMLGGTDHGFLIRDAAEGSEKGGEHGFYSREKGEPGTAASVVISFAAPGSDEPPVPPQPPVPASVSCGQVLTQSTLVANHLSGCLGDGLVVGAPRIIVDLGGHTVDGTGLGAGIRNDGHAEVTVRNGTVQEFDYGVQLLPETEANLVENLTFRLNQVAAVELFDVSASAVRGNTLEGNGGGIELVSGTRDSVVAGNSVSGTGGAGLLVRDATGNLLEGNSVAGGGDLGIGLERASGNSLIDNTSIGNSDGGIELRFASHGNRIKGNTVTESGDHGILVSESDGNELVLNVAQLMSDSGITLDDANDGVVRGNDVRFNTGGLQLDGSSRNLLEVNDASQTTGIGIELGGGSLQNVLEGNRADANGAQGIYIADAADEPGSGNLLRSNTASGNGSDGIVVTKEGHAVMANVARDNLGWGINAALLGTIDGGGNVATGNGKPEQCVGVVCANEWPPPETAITEGPADPTSQTVATFVFTAPGAAGFECSLDDAAFLSCASPVTYADLAAGRHAFRVRARDAAGGIDPIPAFYAWTVDTSAPETTMTAAPPFSTTDTGASFSFTAGEAGATFECAPDEAAFAACTSPRTLAGLAPGEHRFRVRAIDLAGNVDPTPATHSWAITAPLPPGGGGGGGVGGGAGSGGGGDADLVISLSTSAATVAAGTGLTVTITVANRGGLAEGVAVMVTLSPNASPQAASSDRGAGCGSGAPIDCDLDFLGPPGTVRLALAVTAGGPVVVRASARARQSDSNLADNEATLTIQAAPAASPPTGRPKARPTVRSGTARADTLRGTAGRDVLRGLAGRDVLYGLGGDDTLVGGTGVDRLFGGAGNDTIAARDRARDTIACGSGRDVVQADRGDRVARDCERVVTRARRS